MPNLNVARARTRVETHKNCHEKTLEASELATAHQKPSGGRRTERGQTITSSWLFENSRHVLSQTSPFVRAARSNSLGLLARTLQVARLQTVWITSRSLKLRSSRLLLARSLAKTKMSSPPIVFIVEPRCSVCLLRVCVFLAGMWRASSSWLVGNLVSVRIALVLLVSLGSFAMLALCLCVLASLSPLWPPELCVRPYRWLLCHIAPGLCRARHSLGPPPRRQRMSLEPARILNKAQPNKLSIITIFILNKISLQWN